LVDLPNVVGMSIEDATRTLEGADFSVNVGPPVDSDAPEGTIAEQDPGAGQVASGTTVTISPSNGDGATVPDVTGQVPAKAVSGLHSAGFNNVTLHPSCNANGAEVTSTSPAAGTAAKKSATVTVRCT